ncbi:SGNH/GDSL hydrolase family protein [Burkholderia cepacia]|uniref:hypothetical protein n=1 Tax=Burkholderia cepacia TaxID=292 RepID=UPI00158B1D06|nr:hypothetical protein [Burkholderia cepacia]
MTKGEVAFRATGGKDETTNRKLTLTITRNELFRIVRERAISDQNIHYVDGRNLYGELDFDEFPLPDRLHPSPAADRRVAERFAEYASNETDASVSARNHRSDM